MRPIAAASVPLLSAFAMLLLVGALATGASAGNGGRPSAETRTSKLKELTVSPMELSFDESSPFEPSAPRIVTIHNPNPVAVDIIFIASSDPEFVPSFKCAGFLAAHGDCGEAVVFTPSSDRKKTANLIIVNGASEKPLKVKMTGKGKGAPVATMTATPTATPTPVAALCPSENPGACPPSGPPSISSIIPSSAVAGDREGVALAVCGCNLTPSTAVQWNGVGRMTTFVSSSQLNALIAPADVANVGVDQVTVSANTATSAPQTFFVGSTGGPGYAVLEINQQTNDLAYDAVNQMIYLSVPHLAPTNGDSIALVKLADGQISLAQFAGGNPDVLAISDDDQFLYAGIDGAGTVERFKLPYVIGDISYPLGSDPRFGPYHALDLQVAPGSPHTTAVTLALSVSPHAEGGVEIFDDSTPRLTIAPGWIVSGNAYDSLQWGSDTSTLYAANTEISTRDFYTLAVNSGGVTLQHDYPDSFARDFKRIHFDPGSKLIYSDEGRVIDPSTGNLIGQYSVGGGVVVPDSALNTLFFVSLSPFEIGTTTIEAYDLTKFNLVASITFPTVAADPIRIIRWGTNGLAFNTDQGPVYLIGGNFVH